MLFVKAYGLDIQNCSLSILSDSGGFNSEYMYYNIVGTNELCFYTGPVVIMNGMIIVPKSVN